MPTHLRPAHAADVARMVELSEQKRQEYQTYQPIFWRKAASSRAVQTPYFAELLTRPHIIALVHETNGLIDGFVIAAVIGAPPVYDPGGLTCMIDDFCVAMPDQWASVGKALLAEVGQLAQGRGACQFVVVCGHLDQPKRTMLAAAGLTISSEWYTGLME
jgi:hypothetical protein